MIIPLLILLLSQNVLSPSITFEQFAVKETFSGKLVKPDLLSHPKAKTYRTILSEKAKGGPNFAGHYTVVSIGCGTGCNIIAVVDARIGGVYFPKGLHHVHSAGWWHEPYGPVFKLSSRLFVVYGQANSEEAAFGISYFEWTGRDFKLLKFEPHDRGVPPKVKPNNKLQRMANSHR